MSMQTSIFWAVSYPRLVAAITSKANPTNFWAARHQKLMASLTRPLIVRPPSVHYNWLLVLSTDTYLESDIRHYFENSPICEHHSRNNNIMHAASNNFGESKGTIMATHVQICLGPPCAVPITDSASLCQRCPPTLDVDYIFTREDFIDDSIYPRALFDDECDIMLPSTQRQVANWSSRVILTSWEAPLCSNHLFPTSAVAHVTIACPPTWILKTWLPLPCLPMMICLVPMNWMRLFLDIWLGVFRLLTSDMRIELLDCSNFWRQVASRGWPLPPPMEECPTRLPLWPRRRPRRRPR